MKILTMALAFVLILAADAGAQKKVKPWTEWSEKEALKVLNESAWGQTQTETNTSEMVYKPTPRNGGISSRPLDSPSSSGSADSSAQGALNQATNINYRIRLLTSKPIRQAVARRALLQNPQLAEQLKAFAEQPAGKYIVVAVDYDSSDRRFTSSTMQIFNSVNTGVLKNNTYLETKDGKRVFLQEYIAPINDGMGAKFVFPRTVGEEPFVSPDGGFLRFYCEMAKDLKLNMRFKISDMTYDGKLEY